MKKKKNNNRTGQKKKNTVSPLNKTILDILNHDTEQSLSENQIARKLGFGGKKNTIEVTKALVALELSGQINELPNGEFISIHSGKQANSKDSLTGIVDFVNSRFAYVLSEGMENDIWVSSRNINGAFDGDEVEVVVTKSGGDNKRPEGKVIRVIKRGRKEYVGRLELSSKYAFVIPDYKKMHSDIFVPLDQIGKAKANDKVIVKVDKWPKGDENPMGSVIRVLGQAGEHNAEIHSIMAEFGLPFEFPNGVEKFAEEIPDKITSEEIGKRRDMRKVTTFTIDPHDAKDFDDALSVQKLKNGNYEIGVHIADVTHYLATNTPLDEEAYNRATSVYLVDRTIPMLPERLSNFLCSLRPEEEKLTFSAVFELDEDAKVVSQWFGCTVTYSDRRFTYEEAQECIENGAGDFYQEINLLNGLAKKLKKKRFAAGAVNFETVEVKFDLDENGKPLGLTTKVRKDAHKLIEEFMLLANKKVAEYVYKKHKGEDTFVYRVHDNPDAERFLNFATFAGRFGHKVNAHGNVSSELNKLMEDVVGKPEQNVLESLAIRAMAKAVYTTTPKGHFGLAFDHYTHFTSPIRRYPDVMVHRLLQHYLDGKKSPPQDEYEEKCKHSSEREKRAADAERASIKYKQVEYMQMMEEQDFEGIIVGVTEWGIFVEITLTKCEGMVRLASLEDDYYEFDEKNYRIIGKNNKKMYTLGDAVTVRVVGTDIDKRTIDLEFVKND